MKLSKFQNFSFYISKGNKEFSVENTDQTGNPVEKMTAFPKYGPLGVLLWALFFKYSRKCIILHEKIFFYENVSYETLNRL